MFVEPTTIFFILCGTFFGIVKSVLFDPVAHESMQRNARVAAMPGQPYQRGWIGKGENDGCSHGIGPDRTPHEVR